MSTRGQATVEYMLILSVVVIAIVACAFIIVPIFRSGTASLGEDVAALLRGEGNAAVPGREPSTSSSCPYTFDSRTGRWHDESADYTMISFADASAEGCR